MDKTIKQPPPKIRTTPAATAHATDHEYSYSTGMVSPEETSHRTECRKTSRHANTIMPEGRERKREKMVLGMTCGDFPFPTPSSFQEF